MKQQNARFRRSAVATSVLLAISAAGAGVWAQDAQQLQRLVAFEGDVELSAGGLLAAGPRILAGDPQQVRDAVA